MVGGEAEGRGEFLLVAHAVLAVGRFCVDRKPTGFKICCKTARWKRLLHTVVLSGGAFGEDFQLPCPSLPHPL